MARTTPLPLACPSRAPAETRGRTRRVQPAQVEPAGSCLRHDHRRGDRQPQHPCGAAVVVMAARSLARAGRPRRTSGPRQHRLRSARRALAQREIRRRTRHRSPSCRRSQPPRPRRVLAPRPTSRPRRRCRRGGRRRGPRGRRPHRSPVARQRGRHNTTPEISPQASARRVHNCGHAGW